MLPPGEIAVKKDQKIKPDFSNDNSETPLDSNFIPERGNALFIGGVERSKTEGELQYMARPLWTVKALTYDASASFEIGIFKKTSIGAELSYILMDESQYHYGVASTRNGQNETYKDKGFYDPVFSIKHRLLDQEFSSIYFDLELQYSPKVMKAEQSSTTKKGSPGKGGQAISLGGRFTKKTHFITAYLQGDYRYATNRRIKDLDDSSLIASDWRDELLAGCGLQKLLTQSVAIEIGFNYFWDNAYTISTETTESLIGRSKGTEVLFQALAYSQSKRMMIGVRQTFITTNEHDKIQNNVSFNYVDDQQSKTLIFAEFYL